MNELRNEMKRLVKIMEKHDLHPVIIGNGYKDPLSRTIFCHALASKHKRLYKPSVKTRYGSDRQEVARFLGYTDTNSVKKQFSEGMFESFINYLDYGEKYKFIKEEFNNSVLWQRLVEERKRCEAITAKIQHIEDLILE